MTTSFAETKAGDKKKNPAHELVARFKTNSPVRGVAVCSKLVAFGTDSDELAAHFYKYDPNRNIFNRYAMIKYTNSVWNFIAMAFSPHKSGVCRDGEYCIIPYKNHELAVYKCENIYDVDDDESHHDDTNDVDTSQTYLSIPEADEFNGEIPNTTENTTNLKFLHSFGAKEHDNKIIHQIAWNPVNPQQVATGGLDKAVIIWDNILTQNPTQKYIFKGFHFEKINCLCWNADGSVVFSGGGDGNCFAYQVNNGCNNNNADSSGSGSGTNSNGKIIGELKRCGSSSFLYGLVAGHYNRNLVLVAAEDSHTKTKVFNLESFSKVSSSTTTNSNNNTSTSSPGDDDDDNAYVSRNKNLPCIEETLRLTGIKSTGIHRFAITDNDNVLVLGDTDSVFFQTIPRLSSSTTNIQNSGVAYPKISLRFDKEGLNLWGLGVNNKLIVVGSHNKTVRVYKNPIPELRFQARRVVLQLRGGLAKKTSKFAQAFEIFTVAFLVSAFVPFTPVNNINDVDDKSSSDDDDEVSDYSDSE